jgi:retron-type reverse transcriptase
MRSLMEAYYEPQFSDRSHGFRPGRGCHTALRDIHVAWKGTVWYIEGDIKGCFDNIDHSVLLSILREKIRDNRFLALVEKLLKAGYLEQWTYRPTLSGTPQGGIVTPPTTLRTISLGAPLKRGRTHPIDDANLLLVDLDLLDQRPDDLPSRRPIRLS